MGSSRDDTTKEQRLIAKSSQSEIEGFGDRFAKGDAANFGRSKKERARQSVGKQNFEARGANEAKVEAQTKTAAGGGGTSVTGFDAGVISVQGITAQEFGVDSNTPVNSKQGGR